MTTAGQAADLVKSLPWYVVVGGPIVLTAALAFVAARISFTKKEKADFEQTNYTNTTKLLEQHDAAYTKYTCAITAYAEAEQSTFELFKEIATCGDSYFIQACLMCDAILSGKVDVLIRDNTLLPKVRDMAYKTLPAHYATLKDIARKKGYPYRGELRREDYPGIFNVVEKFGLQEP